ncbi:hypothetical protein DFH07DRAFT_1065879 [Mycena maculata]|uniref:F-box domain-containing protein n=1 Tax=Mycena maculata TaxID=230809 RepID=A0AAD7MU69_9AGAR|nr:hypothetical protein DFH07DRAFT_1065879 [Mycena maculata]
MIDTLPPEIFARMLEIAIETWGVGFLPAICLVSSSCYDVVLSTPSLWGIIVVDKQSRMPLLDLQLAKAKATDLRITFPRKGWQNHKHKHFRRFVNSLVALAHNWVQVEMPTSLLSLTRWADMRRVEALSLRYSTSGAQPNREASVSAAEKFFGSEAVYTMRNLHSFTAMGLSEEWVTRFLSPRITYFKIGRLAEIPASTVQRYLSLIPAVHTLHLHSISFLPLSAREQTVNLSNLTNLELVGITNLTPLLLNMRVSALRTLSIRSCFGEMRPVLSQWSEAGFLPSHLQTLELAHCFSQKDIPFLIRWLARLPALLRLTIAHSDEIADPTAPSASAENDLFRALAVPDGAGPVVGGWLCPALIHLCLDTSLRSVADILPIVRARCADPTPGSPARLQSIQAQVCSSGTVEELDELRAFFADDSDVGCVCLGCSFNLSI